MILDLNRPRIPWGKSVLVSGRCRTAGDFWIFVRFCNFAKARRRRTAM